MKPQIVSSYGWAESLMEESEELPEAKRYSILNAASGNMPCLNMFERNKLVLYVTIFFFFHQFYQCK